MEDYLNEVNEIISRYDQSETKFSEVDISQDINKVIKKHNVSDIHAIGLAEVLAFGFIEKYEDQETGWGTYFGPMMVWTDQDGNRVESPSIKRVTPDTITYWSERAGQAKHPILKARYSSLVWDFSKIVTGNPPHYSIAQIVIDSIQEIAKRNCHEFEGDVIKKLEYALSIATSINDTTRIQTVRDTIIEYEDVIAEDDKPGLWGFSYDLLWDNKKVSLTETIKQKLIDDLENRLVRVSTKGSPGFNPWSTERAALRLASHYRKLNKYEDVKRVLLIFETVFDDISENASPLQASAWLQHVHSVFLEFNLREEAQRIEIKLAEIGPKTNEEMKTFTHEIKISKEEMDQYIQHMTAGNLEEVLIRIAAHFIPKKNEIEKQLKDLSKEAPLSFLFSTKLQDYRGRIIATIGSLDNDLIGNIVHRMSQNMRFSSMFLRVIMDNIISKLNITTDVMVDYISRSPIFKADKLEIIKQGIQAYLDGSSIIAIHLLVPQIEEAIRNLLELTGVSILKPSRGGGFNLKLLDELLREQHIVDVFGEDATLYFRVLLTDQRGWNLRNDVCHGIIPSQAFHINIADRVIHVLLCLALVREHDIDEK